MNNVVIVFSGTFGNDRHFYNVVGPYENVKQADSVKRRLQYRLKNSNKKFDGDIRVRTLIEPHGLEQEMMYL